MRRTVSAMARPSSILVNLMVFCLSNLVAAQTDNGDECNCFRTNGSSQGYFAYHRFHDYRNVAAASPAPAVVSNVNSATNAPPTSNFFAAAQWTSDWSIQNWNNSGDLNPDGGATVLRINSPNNIYIEQSKDSDPSYTSYLTLRTSRLPGFQSAAEIDSTEQNYHYMSARFMARVVGSAGACAGMFTYLGNSNPNKIQEADIEILTGGPRNKVQYTNQPSTVNGNDVPQATINGTVPYVRDWSVWNIYRMDWMPKQTSWYMNGMSVANISFQTPTDPAGLILNMWSDGGVWTGNMSLYDEAYLQIQWIELVYNTSGAYGGSKRSDQTSYRGALERRKGTPGCRAVCSIDEKVNVTGTPALLYNSTAGLHTYGAGMSLAWIPVILAAGAIFGFL